MSWENLSTQTISQKAKLFSCACMFRKSIGRFCLALRVQNKSKRLYLWTEARCMRLRLHYYLMATTIGLMAFLAAKSTSRFLCFSSCASGPHCVLCHSVCASCRGGSGVMSWDRKFREGSSGAGVSSLACPRKKRARTPPLHPLHSAHS